MILVAESSFSWINTQRPTEVADRLVANICRAPVKAKIKAISPTNHAWYIYIYHIGICVMSMCMYLCVYLYIIIYIHYHTFIYIHIWCNAKQNIAKRSKAALVHIYVSYIKNKKEKRKRKRRRCILTNNNGYNRQGNDGGGVKTFDFP